MDVKIVSRRGGGFDSVVIRNSCPNCIFVLISLAQKVSCVKLNHACCKNNNGLDSALNVEAARNPEMFQLLATLLQCWKQSLDSYA